VVCCRHDHRDHTEAVPRGQYLALADGKQTRLLALENNITHIGRGSGADVRFDEHRVSRSHAILVRHGRHYRVLDNRSSNGTFVNRRRVLATNIQNGDELVFGPVAVRFVAVD
jgi:pSer/pThr/pTyr-binding forkhead associated (FHA) protein